jgi:DNA-binding LacI/PurR family transcriptional regulator
MIAAHVYPALTTMELLHYQMGMIGELLRLIAQGEPTTEPPLQHKIHCPLIERDSV